MKVVITGGAGYIGSTIASFLADSGHEPVIIDSLIRGHRPFVRDFSFYQGDIADREVWRQLVTDHKDVTAVIHCAALINVPESVQKPYLYYRENVTKSMEMFKICQDFSIHRVVFSSSASIYGPTADFQVDEMALIQPNCPYARTKFMMELVLEDICRAGGLRAVALRYFNPIGADPSLRSGLADKNPSHILGKLVALARGECQSFPITGTNWPTRDGSGIRDYFHVWDLARAHVLAMEKFDQLFQKNAKPVHKNYNVINLGTGTGVTVREMIAACEDVCGRKLKTMEADPRPGDCAGAFANCEKARLVLDWQASLSLSESIRHALAWSDKRHEILGF